MAKTRMSDEDYQRIKTSWDELTAAVDVSLELTGSKLAGGEYGKLMRVIATANFDSCVSRARTYEECMMLIAMLGLIVGSGAQAGVEYVRRTAGGKRDGDGFGFGPGSVEDSN